MDNFTEKEFEEIYNFIKSKLIIDKEVCNEQIVYVLGGQPGAGKSTLIETLRILLNEKTKSETRKKFRILIAEIKNMNNEVNSINEQIEEKKIEINNIITKINENIEEKKKLGDTWTLFYALDIKKGGEA